MKRTNRILPCLALALALALAACDAKDAFEGPLEVGSFVDLATGIAAIDSTRERVLFVGAKSDGVDLKVLREIPKGERILDMVGGPDPAAPASLFLLTGPEDERETEIDEALVRIDPSNGVQTEWPVGSVFGGLTFCPKKRFAVLYHDGSEDQSLYNPNEVAVVDLLSPASQTNPQVLSIDIGGRTVSSVAFVDPMEIVGLERTLVVFMAQGLVKLVDIANLAAGALSVKLVTDDDPRTVIPQKVISRPSDGVRDPMLFVLASGSRDIYAISLVERTDGQEGFWASLNQYEGGEQPSDLAVVDDGGAPLLVVANASGSTLNVIDVDTADAFSLSLQGSPSRILARGEAGAKELVIFGNQTGRVYFLAAADLAKEKGGNLDYLVVPDWIETAVPLDDDRLFVRTMNDGGFAVIDLAAREITRLSFAGAYDWTGAVVVDDVFFVADPGDSRVVSLDLATGHPEPLVLDEQLRSLHVFADAKMGMAVHETAVGRATLFPLASPTRDNAFVVDGLWISGFLDEKEVE